MLGFEACNHTIIIQMLEPDAVLFQISCALDFQLSSLEGFSKVHSQIELSFKQDCFFASKNAYQANGRNLWLNLCLIVEEGAFLLESVPKERDCLVTWTFVDR